MQKSKLIIFLILFLIVLLLVHHYAIHGVFFQLEDVNNHETAIMFLIGFLLGFLLGKWKALNTIV